MSQLLSFAAFEVRYHLRRPLTYVFMFTMFMFAFLFATTDAIGIGGVAGKVSLNSPWALNTVLMVLTLVGMIITSAISGTAVLRDFELKSHELLFTTRLSKPSFVLGRFLGAYLTTVLVFSCSALGIAAAMYWPWIDAEKLGPGGLQNYLWPVVVYVLPNALLACALFFAVGILTRSFIAVYVQGVALFVGYSIALTLLSDLESHTRAGLLDPFGIMATRAVQRAWTVVEKNSLLVPFDGLLLYNRLLWVGIGLLVLALAYRAFKMQAFPGARGKAKAPPSELPELPRRDLVIPPATVRIDRLAELRTLVDLYTRGIFADLPFRALFAIDGLLHVVNAFKADELYGTPVYPVTYAMLELIDGLDPLFMIITALYAGELIWRERAVRADQILDATPVSGPRVLLAKILALMTAHAALLAALIGLSVVMQALKGYFQFELGVYLGYVYGITYPGVVLLSLLAFFLHVVVNNKFLGNALVVVLWFVSLAMGSWGLEHRLYNFNNAPGVTYSAMNGYGPDLAAATWFNLYYLAWALVLLAIARLLLVRGTDAGWRARLRLARERLTPAWFAFFAAAMLAWLGLGGFIYYNTNVLNVFRGQDEQDALLAEFERDYKQYEHLPQPRITAVDVAVQLYPERGHMAARGSYTLVNRHDAPIDRVHVYLNHVVTLHQLGFDRASTLEQDDPRLRYQIHKLAEPLGPGETMHLQFDLAYDREGFGNNGRITALVENGSFFNNAEFFPGIGYNRGVELADDDRRKQQDLPLRERTHDLDDAAARANTYIASDADWIDFSASVCTSPDQIAIAPGYLQREWTEAGRRCFAYEMDAKILPFYAFLSARYAVLRDRWNDVAIEVYYQPGHEYNLERMVDATKKSLDYFTKNFGPYQHRQFRILEFPRYAQFAQAFPNTIPYSEAIGFIARVDPDDPRAIDYPFYVTAHELAHQWWAHQVIGADVQGSTLLSESLSQYSALMVMEREYGRDKMKRFLRYELDAYLRGRSGERKQELPLLRVENQDYVHYRKGSLVFYALRDYLGEDVLNAALARYVKKVAFQPPPFTISRELIAELRQVTPPEHAHLIEDMFETITLFDNRVLSASVAEKDGKHVVTLELGARKIRADGLGVEQDVPLTDDIDVGVFAAPSPGEEIGRPLYLKRHRITEQTTTLEIVVDEPPVRAGIDPYNKLIDRIPGDNTISL